MYCALCGGAAIGQCTACLRHLCERHRRSWLGLTLCPNCRRRTAPIWLVLLTAVLVLAALYIALKR